MNKLTSLFHLSIYYRRQEDKVAFLRHDCIHSYTLNNKITSFPHFKCLPPPLFLSLYLHAKKIFMWSCFPFSFYTDFSSFLYQIFQTNCLYVLNFFVFSFPSLNPVLPLLFHLTCSLKSYWLIPLCQTKSPPSALILFDLHADHPSFKTPHLADISVWASALSSLLYPPTWDFSKVQFSLL